MNTDDHGGIRNFLFSPENTCESAVNIECIYLLGSASCRVWQKLRTMKPYKFV